MHTYEVRPREDHRGVDPVSDALPFGRLWYDGPNAASNAIGYASIYSRSYVSCLSAQYPWIRCVYEATSGYIHLSRKHILNALKPGDATRPESIAISKEDEFIPDSLRVEACAAMQASKDLLLHYRDSW